MDVEKLYKKAQELAEQFEYDLAIKFCKKVLEIEERHFDGLHMLASFSVEVGDMETAIETYQKIADFFPEDYRAHVSLGELLASIEHYKRGLEVFLRQRVQEGLSNSILCDIYSSIAELYLVTEQVDNLRDAECYLKLALEIEPKNVHVLYLQAQFAVSQEQPKENIIGYLDMCLDSLQQISSGKDSFEVNFELRLEISKLLVSFGEFDRATLILYDLVNEQEDDPDVCFLLGHALFQRRLDSEEKDILYIDCHNALTSAKKLYESEAGPDMHDQVAHIDEMLKTLENENCDLCVM
jgi:tetratricopeptide (TPR) repeat protein